MADWILSLWGGKFANSADFPDIRYMSPEQYERLYTLINFKTKPDCRTLQQCADEICGMVNDNWEAYKTQNEEEWFNLKNEGILICEVPPFLIPFLHNVITDDFGLASFYPIVDITEEGGVRLIDMVLVAPH